MKIKIRFTITYFLVFIIIAIGSLFFNHKPGKSEADGGILYGSLFIIVFGVIISLIIEAIVLLFDTKNQLIARFVIMFVVLDLIFYWISRFELLSGLLHPGSENFKISLPVVCFHLVCYTIASIVLFVSEKNIKANKGQPVFEQTR